MKIVIVGGGSYCWTPTLFRDIVLTPGLGGATIVLEDINPKHLADLERCCRAILRQLGKEREFALEATLDPARALRGAHYVILTITTGGYAAMAHDLRIPYRYGIYQPVGDTVGPGGLSRALRNIPVMAGIARQMERHCPQAWLLNITNPMSTLTRCVWRETGIRCVGLCHELYGTLRMIQKFLGGKDWRREFDCVTVGVNHLPWIVALRYKGRDAFPLIRRRLAGGAGSGRAPLGTALDHTLQGTNAVKFALFEAFGALPAAGDRHLVEFFPYFCTREMKKGAAMGVQLTTIEQRRRKWTPLWKNNVRDITRGKTPIAAAVSEEATSKVIAALAGVADWKDVVNIPNTGQVPELPRAAVVETMGLIARDRVYGLPVGAVPPGILTQLQRHVANQELTVEAALKGDRRLALQVLLNDPLCGSIRRYGDLSRMLDELLHANRQWLPQFFR
jgi:alpha-galactosidase